ncbi:hypothetical protein C9J03_26210 [Photobacterium gaetbulicola]|nr:hypothetical protein C9J03_26210 [Photobacterium gaetbulicola]
MVVLKDWAFDARRACEAPQLTERSDRGEDKRNVLRSPGGGSRVKNGKANAKIPRVLPGQNAVKQKACSGVWMFGVFDALNPYGIWLTACFLTC